MRILAVTLARGGSKGIPNKNMYDINGRPLLYYTINEVKKSKYITDYFVSSDSDDILKYSKLQGCNTIKRPDELASDEASSADALLHALDIASVAGRHKYSLQDPYDLIVEIMATNPLKTVEDIDAVIEKLVQTKADSVVSVVQVQDHHPSRLKYIQDDQLKDFYPEPTESRRQDLTPNAYIRNGSIYATTIESFRTHKRRLGPDTRPYIMSEDHTVNIDRLMDLHLAEIIIKARDYYDDMKQLSGANGYL